MDDTPLKDQQGLKNQLSDPFNSNAKPDKILNPGTLSETWLYMRHDGSYVDKYGTSYPQTMFDENRCGLDSIWATRTDDKYKAVCENHDHAFVRSKSGYKLPGENALTVNVKFVADSAKVAASGVSQIIDGLTTVLKFPIYVALGAGVGFFRYLWIEKK